VGKIKELKFRESTLQISTQRIRSVFGSPDCLLSVIVNYRSLLLFRVVCCGLLFFVV